MTLVQPKGPPICSLRIVILSVIQKIGLRLIAPSTLAWHEQVKVQSNPGGKTDVERDLSLLGPLAIRLVEPRLRSKPLSRYAIEKSDLAIWTLTRSAFFLTSHLHYSPNSIVELQIRGDINVEARMALHEDN